MPPTELSFPLSRASSRLHPDEGRRPAGGHRVRCRQRRRSLSPAEWLALTALPFIGASLIAQAYGATLTVTAEVVDACTVADAALTFTDYVSGQDTDLDASANVSVECTNGVTVDIKLGEGPGWDGSDRWMKNGDATLRYNLFSDSNRSAMWGDGVIAAAKRVGPWDPTSHRAQVVYGRIYADQQVAGGTFSDQVSLTIAVVPNP